MKRLLIVLTLVVVCIGSVAALNLNFQTSPDIQSVSKFGTVSWFENTTGGNSYINIDEPYAGTSGFYNAVPSSTTYAAITFLSIVAHGGGSPQPCYMRLYDSGLTPIYTSAQIGAPARIELKMIGGQAYIYQNGLLLSKSGALAVNPSYVGVYSQGNIAFPATTNSFDDFVYGDSSPTSVFGCPDESTVVIYKDLINPSNSGIAYAGSHSIISYANMTSTFGRSTYQGNASQDVVLRSWSSSVPNTNYGVYSTGNSSMGIISWPIADDVIKNPSAPYGEYYTTIDGSGVLSNTIAYIGGGATVAWDAKSHSASDKATVSYTVTGGGYWNTTAYSYKMAVANVFGQFQGTNTSLSAQTGNATFQFTSAMNTGIYYAELIATPKDGSADILMNYDYTTLSDFINFHGYVNNAQTGVVISGANVSMVQNSIVQNVLSATDGNYTASGFITGGTLIVNATASGYRRYNYSFMPLISKTISLNISLVPSTPTVSSTSIGGVDRDTTYGQPISGARVTVRNTSTSESYYQTTSFTGWYLCDAGATCTITASRPYDVWGSIAGWANSTVYAVVPT